MMDLASVPATTDPATDTPTASGSTVRVGPITFGGPDFVVIAGPCAVESQTQLDTIATRVRHGGASMLRGGIYKLRTDPKSFRGLGTEAYEIVRKVRATHGMPVVSEITDPRTLDDLADVVDLIQVGARNMYNYDLLRELGQSDYPILLKRGISARVEEWLLAAEHIAAGGNDRIILCERGVRTFETLTRNMLDLAGVAFVKNETHFPVVVDPSHGTGIPSLIGPMSKAAVAIGADGLLIEVHDQPSKALSDAAQAIDPDHFTQIVDSLRPLLAAVDRPLHAAPAQP